MEWLTLWRFVAEINVDVMCIFDVHFWDVKVCSHTSMFVSSLTSSLHWVNGDASAENRPTLCVCVTINTILMLTLAQSRCHMWTSFKPGHKLATKYYHLVVLCTNHAQLYFLHWGESLLLFKGIIWYLFFAVTGTMYNKLFSIDVLRNIHTFDLTELFYLYYRSVSWVYGQDSANSTIRNKQSVVFR